jgi:hypothetical protein
VTPMVTSNEGTRSKTTVKVATPPLSELVRPLVGLTTTVPAVRACGGACVRVCVGGVVSMFVWMCCVCACSDGWSDFHELDIDVRT